MEALQIIEGTTEEITTLLQSGAFAGCKLRAIVELSEEKDFSDGLPDLPYTVKDRDHLEQLLRAGLASPKHEVTDETWEHIRQQVRSRSAVTK